MNIFEYLKHSICVSFLITGSIAYGMSGAQDAAKTQQDPLLVLKNARKSEWKQPEKDIEIQAIQEEIKQATEQKKELSDALLKRLDELATIVTAEWAYLFSLEGWKKQGNALTLEHRQQEDHILRNLSKPEFSEKLGDVDLDKTLHALYLQSRRESPEAQAKKMNELSLAIRAATPEERNQIIGKLLKESDDTVLKARPLMKWEASLQLERVIKDAMAECSTTSYRIKSHITNHKPLYLFLSALIIAPIVYVAQRKKLFTQGKEFLAKQWNKIKNNKHIQWLTRRQNQ